MMRKTGETPSIVVSTRAELPTGAATGQTVMVGERTPAAAIEGMIAYIKDLRLEVIFDGVDWVAYQDRLYLKDGETPPSNPIDGAIVEFIETGEIRIARGGSYISRD